MMRILNSPFRQEPMIASDGYQPGKIFGSRGASGNRAEQWSLTLNRLPITGEGIKRQDSLLTGRQAASSLFTFDWVQRSPRPARDNGGRP